MSKLYKLNSVYELDKVIDGVNSTVRIEIFENANDAVLRRVRVWARRSYDLYPTFINIGKSNDQMMYSSDMLAMDITNMITDDLSIIEGKIIEESELLQDVLEGVNKFYDDE